MTIIYPNLNQLPAGVEKNKKQAEDLPICHSHWATASRVSVN